VSEAGEYCATITDANGLETECCLSLSFFDNPSCMIDGPDQICVGETATYTANVGGGQAPFSYEWSGPGGFTASSGNIEVSAAGEYMATVTDANGCETECTKTLDIIDILVELTADNTEIILGGETTLTATATACENCTYEWTGPNGIIDEDGSIITVTPELPLPAANEYVYSVQVSENGLCPASDTITIRVLTFCDPDHIYLPNAFTPNGDNLNDELGIISNTLDLLTDMELMIYNRWGEEIFRTTNPKDTWDGTYRGDPLPPDVYGYYLWVLCPGSGEELVQKGNITLLR
jgi:gliding motility-associated-like protein